MAASYRKIDYRVRPAKSIERKMMGEMLRSLSEFARLDSYRYIGFGSLYFSDFTLFHRLLGFKSMISIENTEDPNIKERFAFNSPYKHVEMKYGLSTNVLAGIEWHERTILWLDYDGCLDTTVLNDLEVAFKSAKTGSVIFISVNAMIFADEDDQGKKIPILDSLKNRLGADMIPAETKPSDLSGWSTAKVYRKIITNKIEETLRKANAVLPSASKKVYKQIVNFHYEDNAKMLTVGGILFETDQLPTFERCAFHKLPFVSFDDTPYHIDPPLLTFKEVRRIDALIPFDNADYKLLPVPRSDIERYLKVYRYFPNFTETEV
jgi:hypothetical protein